MDDIHTVRSVVKSLWLHVWCNYMYALSGVGVLSNFPSLLLLGFSASEVGFDLDVLLDYPDDGKGLSWSGLHLLVVVVS